jgi:2-phospho-L-lactate guanylyltransferase
LHAADRFVELEASEAPGLILDVDTVDGLEAVLHHGVGDHTAEAVARLADRKGTP